MYIPTYRSKTLVGAGRDTHEKDTRTSPTNLKTNPTHRHARAAPRRTPGRARVAKHRYPTHEKRKAQQGKTARHNARFPCTDQIATSGHFESTKLNENSFTWSGFNWHSDQNTTREDAARL